MDSHDTLLVVFTPAFYEDILLKLNALLGGKTRARFPTNSPPFDSLHFVWRQLRAQVKVLKNILPGISSSFE